MKPRVHDPLRLDVAAFAGEAAALDGAWPLDDLPRLVDLQMPGPGAAPVVQWEAQGESVPVTGGAAELWMDLRASVDLRLQCQRCLGAVETLVQVDRRFRFVQGETQAAALDEEIEEEVLALTRSLDLRELLEDELLLALPLVPRHDRCPEPPPMQFGDLEEADGGEAENPFAALASLKKRPPTN